MTTRIFSRVALLAAAVAALAETSTVRPAAQTDGWASEMAAFQREDQKPTTPGGIVFVGSSSIRLWDLARSFPNLPVINRGFGGSQIIDSVTHADLLVIRHKPRTVILYAGDNDLAGGKTVLGWGLAFAHVGLALAIGPLALLVLKPARLAGDRQAG